MFLHSSTPRTSQHKRAERHTELQRNIDLRRPWCNDAIWSNEDPVCPASCAHCARLAGDTEASHAFLRHQRPSRSGAQRTTFPPRKPTVYVDLAEEEDDEYDHAPARPRRAEAVAATAPARRGSRRQVGRGMPTGPAPSTPPRSFGGPGNHHAQVQQSRRRGPRSRARTPTPGTSGVAAATAPGNSTKRRLHGRLAPNNHAKEILYRGRHSPADIADPRLLANIDDIILPAAIFKAFAKNNAPRSDENVRGREYYEHLHVEVALSNIREVIARLQRYCNDMVNPPTNLSNLHMQYERAAFAAIGSITRHYRASTLRFAPHPSIDGLLA